MPVHHVFTVLCEFAIRDAENRFSFINVINNVRLDRIPGGLASLFIGVAFTGGVTQRMSIGIEDPKKNELYRVAADRIERPPSKLAVHSKQRYVGQVLVSIRPAIFHSEGVHHVVLRAGDRVIHREPFFVFKDPTLGQEAIDAANIKDGG
jgi:hypothetical protein